jgi:cytochrome c-type biogenesis protein CcmH/NrfG
MYPNQDAPRYLAGFAGTLALLVVCILSYLTLPLWLLREAQVRKKKTGHAMPLQVLTPSPSFPFSLSPSRLYNI